MTKVISNALNGKANGKSMKPLKQNMSKNEGGEKENANRTHKLV